MKLLILPILILLGFKYSNSEETILYQDSQKNGSEVNEKSHVNSDKIKDKRSETAPKKSKLESGNLPNYYLKRKYSRSENPRVAVVFPSKDLLLNEQTLKIGVPYKSRILHSVIAFPDEKSPVVASFNSGSIRLIGESRLERNSKRIFIDFNRAIIKDESFFIKAVGINTQGQPGFTGNYHSKELTYFTGDFISSTVAAYFDSLVPRRTNPFGVVVEDNSVDSALKRGFSTGAMASADRFRKKLENIPEFSEIKGPIELEILILEKNKNN